MTDGRDGFMGMEVRGGESRRSLLLDWIGHQSAMAKRARLQAESAIPSLCSPREGM